MPSFVVCVLLTLAVHVQCQDLQDWPGFSRFDPCGMCTSPSGWWSPEAGEGTPLAPSGHYRFLEDMDHEELDQLGYEPISKETLFQYTGLEVTENEEGHTVFTGPGCDSVDHGWMRSRAKRSDDCCITSRDNTIPVSVAGQPVVQLWSEKPPLVQIIKGTVTCKPRPGKVGVCRAVRTDIPTLVSNGDVKAVKRLKKVNHWLEKYNVATSCQCY